LGYTKKTDLNSKEYNKTYFFIFFIYFNLTNEQDNTLRIQYRGKEEKGKEQQETNQNKQTTLCTSPI